MPERLVQGIFDAITDVRGIRVGHWSDFDAATGCTVVCFEKAPLAAVDVRGGAPGTRETDALRPEMLVRRCDALVLSGGSAFGLAAATGVVEWLAAQGIGFPTGARPVPVVPAAILYDLGLGRADITPGANEGAMAARRAKAGAFPRGSIGAGTGATVAKALGPTRMLKGGIGTASATDGSGLIAGALVAVNAVGSIIDPANGRPLAAPRADAAGALVPLEETPALHRDMWAVLKASAVAAVPAIGGNTTIGVVAINAGVEHGDLVRLAAIAQDGLARTIVPSHTRADGDTMFAVATGARPIAPEDYYPLAMLVLRAVERAVLDAVRSATGLAGVPSAGEWTSDSSK